MPKLKHIENFTFIKTINRVVFFKLERKKDIESKIYLQSKALETYRFIFSIVLVVKIVSKLENFCECCVY